MKTGKLFWSMRKDYLQKVIVQHENNIHSIEKEVQHLIREIGDNQPTKQFNFIISKLELQKIELKHENKMLVLAQKSIAECNNNLKIIESPARNINQF